MTKPMPKEIEEMINEAANDEAVEGWQWALTSLRAKNPPICYEHGVRAGFNTGAAFMWRKMQDREAMLVEALEEYCKDREIAHDFPGTGINYAHHYEKFKQALAALKKGGAE
jgi:hypothetical protein